MSSQSIAVLLTCYNRKEKTLNCLSALFNCSLPTGAELTVYLVDDGSTDGTDVAVSQQFPDVKVLKGTGKLFWTGGMRQAFAEAINHHHDYYLWLNDDTILHTTALELLFKTSQQLKQRGYQRVIVTGSTKDPETGLMSYGGVLRGKWWHPCRFHWLTPDDHPIRCDTMNGNVVLIPHDVVSLVGNLDSTFSHYAADFDYGLRATQKGCSVWIAPGYVGTCSDNPSHQRIPNSDLSLDEQLRRIKQPKGLATQDVTLHPFDEWKEFTRRHAGPLWPIYWLLPYRRLVKLMILHKLNVAKA